MSDENLTPEELRDAELRDAELRDAGSIEANTWTITPPGGEPMSLDEHEKQRLEQFTPANDEAVEITDKRPMDEIPGTPQWFASIAAAEARKNRD